MAEFVCSGYKRSFLYKAFREHFCFLKEIPDNVCSDSDLSKIDEQLEKLEEAKRNKKFKSDDFGESSPIIQCHDVPRTSSIDRDIYLSPNISCKSNCVASLPETSLYNQCYGNASGVASSGNLDDSRPSILKAFLKYTVNSLHNPVETSQTGISRKGDIQSKLSEHTEPVAGRSQKQFDSQSIADTDDIFSDKCETLTEPVAALSHRSDEEKCKFSNGRIICLECGKDFRFKCRFEIHYRSHSGLKPYTCYICEKRFSKKFNLSKHMLFHTGEKPYSCDKCDYKSNQRGHLQRHLRSHADDQNHACSLCEMFFSNANALRAHCRTVHQKNELSF